MKSLDKFISKAKKNNESMIRIRGGVFDYCDEERIIKHSDQAYFYRLKAGKLYYIKDFPVSQVSKEEFLEEYGSVLSRLINEGFILCRGIIKK